MKNADFGQVEYKGKVLTLTQQPYVDTKIFGSKTVTAYFASAEDDEGNEYEVTFTGFHGDIQCDADSIDWDDYKVRAL